VGGSLYRTPPADNNTSALIYNKELVCLIYKLLVEGTVKSSPVLIHYQLSRFYTLSVNSNVKDSIVKSEYCTNNLYLISHDLDFFRVHKLLMVRHYKVMHEGLLSTYPCVVVECADYGVVLHGLLWGLQGNHLRWCGALGQHTIHVQDLVDL